MLEILEKKNPDVKSLRDFIRYLKHIPSFDSILNTFQVVTRAEDLSLRERNEDGLTLNEILPLINHPTVHAGNDFGADNNRVAPKQRGLMLKRGQALYASVGGPTALTYPFYVNVQGGYY